MGTKKNVPCDKYYEFDQLLNEVDETKHKMDAIDYYEIVGERVKAQSYVYRAKMQHNCSLKFLNFIDRNMMEKDLLKKTVLDPNVSYGVIVNKKCRRLATKKELGDVYDSLKERGLPICVRTIFAQLRRDWQLNSDVHYPNLPLKEEFKDKKKQK